MATPPDFTVGQVLTAAQMNAVGLWKIDSFNVSATANPFINGCFGSDFRNYRILLSLYGSGANAVRMRVRSGTSTVETGAVYDRTGFHWTTAINNANSLNEVSFFVGTVSTSSSQPMNVTIDVFNPNVANVYTTLFATAFQQQTPQINYHFGRIETNTQYTGFEFIIDSSQTITGQATVYGYN